MSGICRVVDRLGGGLELISNVVALCVLVVEVAVIGGEIMGCGG